MEEERLKVPRKLPKQRRLWLNDGSAMRLKPTHKNHVGVMILFIKKLVMEEL